MSDISSVHKQVVFGSCHDVFIHHDMSRLDEYIREDYSQLGLAERLLRGGLMSPGLEEKGS